MVSKWHSVQVPLAKLHNGHCNGCCARKKHSEFLHKVHVTLGVRQGPSIFPHQDSTFWGMKIVLTGKKTCLSEQQLDDCDTDGVKCRIMTDRSGNTSSYSNKRFLRSMKDASTYLDKIHAQDVTPHLSVAFHEHQDGVVCHELVDRSLELWGQARALLWGC